MGEWGWALTTGGFCDVATLLARVLGIAGSRSGRYRRLPRRTSRRVTLGAALLTLGGALGAQTVINRLDATYGCDRTVMDILVADVPLSRREQCVLATAGIRIWTDSLRHKFGASADSMGRVRQVRLGGFGTEGPFAITDSGLVRARQARIRYFWSIVLDLPTYHHNGEVLIDRAVDEFIVRLIHKPLGPTRRPRPRGLH